MRRDAGERAFDQLTNDASFIKPTSMRGQLFEVGGYPAGCYQPDAGMRIIGELYQVDAARLFAALGGYEECDSHFSESREYRRQRVPVVLDDDTMVHAWAYLYNDPTDEIQIIESGDYLLWQRANDVLLNDVKCDQENGFANNVFGKLLFWLVLMVVIVLAGFWFFGHIDLLSYIQQQDSAALTGM